MRKNKSAEEPKKEVKIDFVTAMGNINIHHRSKGVAHAKAIEEGIEKQEMSLNDWKDFVKKLGLI